MKEDLLVVRGYEWAFKTNNRARGRVGRRLRPRGHWLVCPSDGL